MSKLTKQEWEKIEEDLKYFMRGVKLRCDGYDVDIMLTQVSQFKNGITIYVNGVMKGVWMLAENNLEESRRFFKLRSKGVYSTAEKKRLVKLFGKREANKRLDLEKRFEWREPFWTSFNALKRHLIANNDSIKLVNE